MKPGTAKTAPATERLPDAEPSSGPGPAAVAPGLLSPASRPDPLRLVWVVRFAGAIAILIGGLHLGAWLTGNAERWSPGAITMKTNAALAFTLAGTALLLLGRERTSGWRRALGTIVSVLVLLIGATTLAENLFQADLGLDQLLATEQPGAAGTGSPNRMGPPASSCFVLLGLGLLALPWIRARRFAPYAGLATCVISLVPAVGYVFGINAFYDRINLTGIAWPTVVALLSLGVGTMAAVRSSGPAAAILRTDAAGMFFRGVLAWALLIPMVLGYLVVQAERAGVFDTVTGTGTLVITLVLFFSIALWKSATRIGDAVAAQGQAYAALRESDARAGAAHERLRIHVEATPLALIEWNSEYRLTRFSSRAEQMFGWTADEVVGRRIDDIPWVPEEDWPAVRAVIQQMTSRTQLTTVSANRNLRKDGSIIHCEWYNSALTDEAGRPLSVLSLVLDVTDRKRVEEALRLSEEQARARAAELEAVLDTVPAAVWIAHDERANDITTNRYGAELLRAPERTNVSVTAPLDARPRHFRPMKDGVEVDPNDLPIQAAARFGKEFRQYEFDIVFDDGTARHLVGNSSPLRGEDGARRGSVGAFIDISERKRAEEEIRSSDRRKTEFLAMLSHELRNPLAPIRNSVYLLESVAPASEQAVRARDVIRRQTEHLMRLVDDLLDMTRISRGKIALQRSRVDLREVVRKVTDDLLFLFEQTGVELRFEQVAGPVWVEADAVRIAQVVANLLQNAVKFTPERGTVTVEIRAIQGRAEIRVRDTGVGIEPGQVEKMFEPFAQAEQGLARTQGGLGLGLSLVKALVELHGGTVEARSEGPGRGAEFVISLPLSTTGTAPTRQLSPVANPNGRRIVIIEDNVDAGQSLADILELAGHTVRLARDGRSGVALARELKPDVVLCDIGLPDIDGYEVVRTLRRDDSLRDALLIALSGYAQPEDVQRAKAAGFDGHLPKPAPLDELAALLARDREPGPS